MTSSSLLASDIAYFGNLIKAGLNGITSARHERSGVFTPRWKAAAWTPALVGAALGALSTCFDKQTAGPCPERRWAAWLEARSVLAAAWPGRHGALPVLPQGMRFAASITFAMHAGWRGIRSTGLGAINTVRLSDMMKQEDGHDELQLACIGHCVFQEFDQGRAERYHISPERKVRHIHASLEGCCVDAGAGRCRSWGIEYLFRQEKQVGAQSGNRRPGGKRARLW